MQKVLKVLSLIIGLTSSIVFTLSVFMPVLYTSSSFYFYCDVMGKYFQLIIMVVMFIGLSLSVFFMRRQTRLLGYAIVLSTSIYYLSTVYQIQNYHIGISMTPYAGNSIIIAASVLLLVFVIIGLLYEYSDYRNEMK